MSKRAAGTEQVTTAATAGEINIERSRQSARMAQIQFEGEYTRKIGKNAKNEGDVNEGGEFAPLAAQGQLLRLTDLGS